MSFRLCQTPEVFFSVQVATNKISPTKAAVRNYLSDCVDALINSQQTVYQYY